MDDIQSPFVGRRDPVKTELTTDLIKRLRLESRPVGVDSKGKLIFEANPSSAPFFVWDASRTAPPGFGVKVAGRKTYILRRKVHGKSITSKIGNVADYLDIAAARTKAAAMATTMVETGRNPNEIARNGDGSMTVGAVLVRYRAHLADRAEPASPETLKAVDKARRRFEDLGWNERAIRGFPLVDIKEAFNKGKKAAPSANEQRFRMLSTAVNWWLKNEILQAQTDGRQPTMEANPFTVLTINHMYRSRATVEKQRVEQGKRNPLGPSKSMGAFLEAAWSKKNFNDAETGVHYLILMLLWGCRKSEHAKCHWGELLSEDGKRGADRLTVSHVWLEESGEYGPYVFFYETKGGRSHRLPIAPMALELLRRRQESAAREVVSRGFGSKSRPFVFPARSKFSASGHYSDATELLKRVREEAAIPRLTRHDLRRSFGAVMTALDVSDSIKRRFFNHADVHVTDTYTKAEWLLLRDQMARIEQAILSKAPNIYNALKPADWEPLPAPDPHVCKPAKPRSGRPRKELPARVAA